MGKKKPEEMAAQRKRFIEGALARSYPQRKVERIFDLMEQFAGYGFNKSHSAAYAYLAYVTAYLKAHYPVEFMAALLTSETGNSVKVVKYISECRDMGITVLSPDVNSSDSSFTPAGGAIRFGLSAVRNLGPAAVEVIQKARQEVGQFRSIYQFCESVDLGVVNKRILESLIKSGAMDALGGNRAQLLASLDGAMEAGQRAWRDRQSGQAGLFGTALTESEQAEKPLPNVPDWSPREKLQAEKDVLGFYVTGHPLDQHRDKVTELATHNTSTLENLERGAPVALCGVMVNIQRKRNKEGRPWASFFLEDLTGAVDALIFTTQFESLSSMLEEDQAVLVRGSALPEDNVVSKISVQEIVPLEVARVPMPSLISIRVPLGRSNGDDRIAALEKLFRGKPGETQVRFRLESPRDFSVILDIPARVRPDKEFREAVTRICGTDAMEVLAN
jgi:DNA polymerase-3 subunit alpha